MRNYGYVLKLLLRNILRKSSDNKGKKWFIAASIIIAATYAMIVGLSGYLIVELAPFILQTGLVNEMLTIVLGGGCLVILVLGLVAMLSYLYFSRDTEFFLALPIKPSIVYTAKMTIVYLTELLTTLAIFLPLLIIFGVSTAMPVSFYLGAIILMLLLPLAPLCLASIIAIPLMYVVSFFRNKGALSSIVVLLLFMLFFGGYYYLIMQMQNFDGSSFDPSQIIEQYKAALEKILYVLYPFGAIVKFMTMTPVYGLNVGLSMLVNVLIFVGSIGILGTAAILISAAVYKRGAASQLEGAKSKKKENAHFISSGKVSAIAKKEWKEMIRTPAFSLQCLMGVVLCPIVVIFMAMSFSTVPPGVPPQEMQSLTALNRILPIMIALMMGVCINIGPSTSFTREGEMFYVLKTLPVSAKELVVAKRSIYLITTAISVTLSMIGFVIVTKEFLYALLGLVFLLIFGYGFVNFAMYFDLLRPKLDWKTPTEAVKNSRNAMIPMFIGMAVSMVFMFAGIFVTTYLGGWLSMLLLWCTLYIIAIAVAIIFHKLLFVNARNLIERVG